MLWSYHRTCLRTVGWFQQHDVTSFGRPTSAGFSDRCVRCAAVQIWDQLPLSLRDPGVT